MPNKNEPIRVYYRKNGFVVPYLKYNGQFWSYFIRRILAFIFDSMLFVCVSLLVYFLAKWSIWTSMLLAVAINFVYILLNIAMKNNRSLGMIIGRLRIVNYEGDLVSATSITLRALLLAFYVMPVLGWFLVLYSFFGLLFTKGLTFVDLMTKTQVMDTYKANFYLEMNRDIKNNDKVEKNRKEETWM